MQGKKRSLLSSTDSCRNPAESGQFPEFRRNQFWHSCLPNWWNYSGGMWNGIHIPPEWFRESQGRNGPGMRGTESTIWASSTHQFLLPQPPPPPSTTPIHHRLLTTVVSSPLSHHCHHHHWPPPTSVAHNHHNMNNVAMPCHPVNDNWPWVHDGIQGATSLTASSLF